VNLLVRAGTVVTGDAVLRPGWVSTSGPVITGAGPGSPSGPAPGGLDFPTGILVPGFVDLHVHGGGGHTYTTDRAGSAAAAAAYHRTHGTTRSLASLVTADEATLTGWITTLAGLISPADGPSRAPGLAGIHLEGPWLNPVRRGAHDRALLRDPDPAELDRLLAAGRGHVRMITVAPELPGGLDLIRRIVDAGVVAAIGHTDADLATTRAAIEAGATVATHLFNAMPPLHHRTPGPIAALLADPRVTLELIADGVHLHPALLDLVRAAAGPERIALVTDAMVASGMLDGAYSLGSLDVTVHEGVARVDSSGSIAGGTATTADLFRTAVRRGADAEISDDALLAAVRMTAVTPARTLGLADVGRLRPGFRADLVVLDADLRIEAVLPAGPTVPATAS
jgi:N-acetylglucosamine-6-phosphate deacetylase